MTRLTKVELRRLFSRRLVVLAMLAALAVTGLMLWTTWSSVQPLPEAQLEQAEAAYQQQLADWEEHREERIAECEEAEAADAERTGEEVDYGCEQQEPQREWFIHTAPPMHDSLPAQLGTLAYPLLFLALLIGATSTAAEFATGAMSNWLTFEPRRGRVYASKVAAPGIGVIPVAAIALLLFTGGAWVFNDAQGLADGMTGELWGSIGWVLARILGATVTAAVIGAALGFLLRHTAAVLGAAIGYAIVAEGMLRGLVPSIQRWLIGLNVDGWINHGTTYYVMECTTDATGTQCSGVEEALSFGHSAIYLLVLTVVLVLLGALAFRRRDVG